MPTITSEVGVSNVLTAAIDGIITLGPEMRHLSKPYRSVTDNAMVFVRECIANGISYHATKFRFFIANLSNEKIKSDPFIIVMHNGKAFASKNEIMNRGLLLGVSQRSGSSLNGGGPKVASRSLSDNAVYGIASYCEDGTFAACQGMPNLDKRQWEREDVTEEVKKKFSRLIGKAFTGKDFSVFYFCRIDTNDHSIFELRDSNTLGLLLGDMLTPKIDVKFAQIGIGFNDYRPKDNYQEDKQVTVRELVQKYSSLDSPREWAKARGNKSNDGMMRRDVPSHSEFRRRFCPDFQNLTLEAQNVIVEASNSPLKVVSVNVGVQMEFYPGRAAEVSGNAGWMANVRDLDEDKDGFGGKMGKGLDVGTVPGDRVFYRFSAMASDAQKIDEETGRVHQRFATQPIFSGSDEHRFIGTRLRMPYSVVNVRKAGTSGQPFAILTFDITKVNYVKTYDGDGGSERENHKAFYLDSLIHVGSDFIARQPGLLRKIAEAACEKIVKDDSPNYRKARAIAESYWPQQPEEWLNPYENMGVEQTKRGQQSLKIIDLTTGLPTDKVMHADTDHYYVIYDARTGAGINPRSTTFTSGTRGATIEDATRFLRQRDKKSILENFEAVKEELDPTGNMGIKPILISVTSLQTLWDNEWVDWDSEELPGDLEWDRNNAAFQPSLTINLDYKGMAIMVGKVAEIPAVKAKPPKEKSKKKVAKKSRPVARKGKAGTMDPFLRSNEEPSIMFRFDPKLNLLLWNRAHADVSRYFSRQNPSTEYRDRIQEYAARANQMAKRVYAFLNNEQHPFTHPDVGRVSEGDVNYGDFETFAIHMLVVPYLRDDEGMKNLVSHMDREIDSQSAITEVEADSEETVSS